jgi:transcriptional regulator with XRE-family HTH domain
VVKGENIRKKRKALGLTGQQLADMLGVSKANLYKWEKGHAPSNPKDYIAVEKWLSTGEVESVPHETKEGEKKGEILDEILANLKELRGYTIAILTEQQAGAKVVIGSLERLENKPEGTLSEVADKLAIKIQESLNRLQTGK